MRVMVGWLMFLTLSTSIAAEEGGAILGSEQLQVLTEKIRPSVATIKVSGRDGDQIQMGTGFVVDASGLIATNYHVLGEGRPFTVELSSGRQLRVIGVEASDRHSDLALVRVDVADQPLPALPLSSVGLTQGTPVLAFGNPLGLRNSVVAGIVSALRQIEGREMIQLAMPVQAGNSGGPLVDADGNVCGIINMKSAIDDNLGFAIPIGQLAAIRDQPNPVTIERWVRLGRIDEAKWTPLFGADWQQRGGVLTARGGGDGFGGRSLCLFNQSPAGTPLEIAVQVRLDDESGAAGLAFHSDGEHRHYGFYPSNGRLRLTCFKGSSVYSWQVLEELESEHYLPKQWNHLQVRIESGRLQCFCNGHLVIESTDAQLSSGKFGLVKFRDTNPDFKSFQFGEDLPDAEISGAVQQWLADLLPQPDELPAIDSRRIAELGTSSDTVSRRLEQYARQLEQRAAQVRRLAADVTRAPALQELAELMADPAADDQLLRGALLIAKLDNPDIDVDAYLARIDEMAGEVRSRLPEAADAIARREALHRYLFDENGFHGDSAEYDHPANSHLSRVIDDREGLPITLSILYMELGKRLGMTIEGIGLPGHFVVRHRIDDQREQLVDVFERGKLLSRSEARQLVALHAGREMTDSDLRPQSPINILSRVVNNLIGTASQQQNAEAIHRHCEALVAIRPDSSQSRMLRSQARAMTGRRDGAIEDLDWLLQHDPPALDRDAVLRLRETLIQERP
jgi:regulator of sirC expression with transglutaminase-like and TPR domain